MSKKKGFQYWWAVGAFVGFFYTLMSVPDTVFWIFPNLFKPILLIIGTALGAFAMDWIGNKFMK